MRFLALAIAAAFLLLRPAAPAQASSTAGYSAKAASADFSAKKHKKRLKKEKVEYMRAAPLPPGPK
ncbi:MAG TPA: hypothetical protein VMG39_05035 [Pseudolabrys sp.]|nr:hypothetical protein [Pseudolabrys sp.]